MAENGQHAAVTAVRLPALRSCILSKGVEMKLEQRTVCVPVVLMTIGMGMAAHAGPSVARAKATMSGCSSAEYHQLDFWIGDWDVYDADAPAGPVQARARIEPIAGGCALHELYEQSDGLIGDSILSYDPVRRGWQQTWVTNRGALMQITGNFTGGELVLEGDSHLVDGRSVTQRITWQAKNPGVREFAVMSKDHGKTWSPAFDVSFVKHRESHE
jgi:hypothetical protein